MSHLRRHFGKFRSFGVPARIVLFLVSLLCVAMLPAEESWTVVGPDGGDARAFAAVPGDPHHLYLGTTNSWLYESLDEGASWHRLARLAGDDGFVLDSIVVDAGDPATIYVGAWKNSDNGGLWISHDHGSTWNEVTDFKGKPIHALAQAASDPQVLIAGTLEGVFRTDDSGATWNEISPADSHEIHEIESLAVDPKDAGIIYAGTWHLPWKTTNGGKTWHNIKQGIIEDSDVFSIILDPARSKTVYLSACSGIYKSLNGGVLFHKIHGIPSEARRTRSLMQDPENRLVVYAGTTEGLYKTINAGKTFKRMTDASVVVNDVYVDPTDSNHVLLATDRGGVLASEDAGATFVASNKGISERKVAALLVDRNDPRLLYAGVVNDKAYGGVFRSNDGGEHWEQLGSGLDGRDVFSLAQTKDGAVVAGTAHGIFVLDPAKSDDAPAASGATGTAWSVFPKPDTPESPQSIPEPQEHASVAEAGATASAPPSADLHGTQLPGSRSARAATGDGAASAAHDTPHDAATWQPRNTIANMLTKVSTETVLGTPVNIEKQVKAAAIQLQSPVNALDVSGDVWAAATGYGLVTSRDQGATWQGGPVMGMGDYLSVTANGETLVGARNDSVVISKDSGQSWWPMGVPTMLTHIHRVVFSPDGTLWLGAREGVYYTPDLGKSWMWIERFPLRDVDDLSYDQLAKKLLASSRTSDLVYAINPKTMTWEWWKTGYAIDLIRAAGDRLVAASLGDGVLVGPHAAQIDASPEGNVTAKQ